MNKEVVIIIAEDDEGHAALIMKNLERSGIKNDILQFRDGQEVLDFMFGTGPKGSQSLQKDKTYLLLLDIRMPKVDGIEVLKRLKADAALRKIPVIMITTTDDPREIERCYAHGCSNYILKPLDYDRFVEAIRRLGLFLMVVEMPGPVS